MQHFTPVAALAAVETAVRVTWLLPGGVGGGGQPYDAVSDLYCAVSLANGAPE